MPTQAFSLIEALLVLSLLAIFGLILLPNWQWYQHNRQADLAIQSLQQALNTTQMLAISQQHSLSLCPSLDQQHCQASWQDQLLVFTNPPDPDSIGQRPVAILPLAISHGHLEWRHFSQRGWLSFEDTGRLHDDNGTWLYCPNIANPLFNRALSINALGRLRLLSLRDSQGQLVDSHGQALICHFGNARNKLYRSHCKEEKCHHGRVLMIDTI